MPLFPKPKLPSKHCKSLSELIKAACLHCHVISCLRTPSSPSSFSGENFDDDDDYLDNHYVIIMEIMRARAESKSFAKSKAVFFTCADHQEEKENFGEQEEEYSGGGVAAGGGGDFVAGMVDDDESEAFFSVKSCFSSCLQLDDDDQFDVDEGSAMEYYRLLIKKKRSVFEEFRHCEGWPFGLFRRAVALPPLPRSPADSWMWSKRRVGCKGF